MTDQLFTPVISVFTPTGDADFDGTLARLDDAYWSRYVTVEPFTWQRFTHWWVARRYIQPRDIRRR